MPTSIRQIRRALRRYPQHSDSDSQLRGKRGAGISNAGAIEKQLDDYYIFEIDRIQWPAWAAFIRNELGELACLYVVLRMKTRESGAA